MINATRHIFIAIQLFAVLLQAFDRGLLWSGFAINQNYVAQNLCENKNKPLLNCEGNCQLRKAFEKLDNEKKEQHLPQEIKTDILLCEIWKPVNFLTEQVPFEQYQYPADNKQSFVGFQTYLLKPPMSLV